MNKHIHIRILTPAYIGPPKNSPRVFFCQKRSLAASVPKISGGKVQRWSQASSTGRSVWVAVGCSAYWFPKKNVVGGLALKACLVGKTRRVSGLFLFFWRCGGSFFLVENHLEERCLKSRVGISIFLLEGVQNMGKRHFPKNLA